MKIVSDRDNVRIDKYLGDNLNYSRSLVSKMLKDSYVLVNKKAVKPSYLVRLNDEIEILDGYIKESNVEPTKMELDIVYEDNDIIIINKPSGLVVHEGAGNHNNTLVNGLMYYTTSLSDGQNTSRPGIVHRLDKDTSGLLIVAKNNKAEEELGKMFKEHTITREYIALVCGTILNDKIKIDAPIGRDPKNRLRMSVTPNNSKKAITHLTVLKRYKEYTLVKLRLETGRTHQIRVHMKYINHPIYNDPVYSKECISDFGQFLHSYSMDFNHPITKEHMHFTAELPAYFKDFISTLE